MVFSAGVVRALENMAPRGRQKKRKFSELDEDCASAKAVEYVESGFPIKDVARVAGVHPTTVQRWVRRRRSGQSLKRKAGSGAIPKISAAHTKQIKAISSQPEFRSASRAAGEFSRVTGIEISTSTAYRKLTSGGDRFWLSKVVPQLTDRQKQLRVAFSRREAKRDWSKVLFTDSKYFQLHSDSKQHGVYGKQPAIIEKPKFGPALHVYAAVARSGMSELKVVSGGSTANCTYKTSRGILYKGVSAPEYQAEVLPMFQRAGQQLYTTRRDKSSWVLQQDGAPSHTAKKSRLQAQATAPGGLLPDWPPNSPDLSLIENVWGIMAKELSFLPKASDVKELLKNLNTVKKSISPKVFQKMFDGMAARLEKCIDADGAILTK